MGTRALPIVAAGLLMVVAAPVAQAAEPLPDLRVEVSAPRNVLPVDGWSTVTTTVTNAGTAPAANVRLTITFPDELHSSGWSTSSEWDCTSEPGWPLILTCDHVGELAAGATPYPVYVSAYGHEATAGQVVTVVAEVTTPSTDVNPADNSATGAITFVGQGVIDGRFWNDLNANGVREAGEPAITSAGVSFWSVDDEDQYGLSNTHDGSFYFTVPAKKYYAEVQVRRSQWSFTTPNVGDDTTDSDVTQVSEDGYYRTARSPEFTVPVGDTTTVDIGLVAVPPARS